jgi:hypothetical protein
VTRLQNKRHIYNAPSLQSKHAVHLARDMASTLKLLKLLKLKRCTELDKAWNAVATM